MAALIQIKTICAWLPEEKVQVDCLTARCGCPQTIPTMSFSCMERRIDYQAAPPRLVITVKKDTELFCQGHDSLDSRIHKDIGV